MTTITTSYVIIPTLLCALSMPALALDEGSIRIAPQFLVGTTGFEPGVAGEFRFGTWNQLIIRPELFINDDSDLGAGASVLWSLGSPFDLPDRYEFAVGPRVVHHNSDEHGVEVGALGLWDIQIGDRLTRRHSIEVLAALGVVDQRDDDGDDDGVEFAIAGGAAYAYRF